MNKFVLDTSVLVKLFVNEERREQAHSIFSRAVTGEFRILAPSLIIYELVNALIKNNVPKPDLLKAVNILEEAIEAGILHIANPSPAVIAKAVDMAQTDTGGLGYISSYDSMFHALAITEDAVFITDDHKHYIKTHNRFGHVMRLQDV